MLDSINLTYEIRGQEATDNINSDHIEQLQPYFISVRQIQLSLKSDFSYSDDDHKKCHYHHCLPFVNGLPLI
jgi:hypothetical protein